MQQIPVEVQLLHIQVLNLRQTEISSAIQIYSDINILITN